MRSPSPSLSDERRALRDALHVDLNELAPATALLRAAPVVALFAIGLAVGNTRTALTLAMGANLVAVVSIVGAVRVGIALLIADALALGFATFVGSATAWNEPLHLVLLGLFGFVAGLLVVLGQGPATAGAQSVIAFVVFGRFMATPLVALQLGALVALGAAAEAVVLSLLRLPMSLRAQTLAIANGYRRAAAFAEGETGASGAAVAEAFDRAAATLDRPALFGRADVRMLRTLVDEGRRLRIDIGALQGLRQRLVHEHSTAQIAALDRSLDQVAEAISVVADRVADLPRRHVQPQVLADTIGVATVRGVATGDARGAALAAETALHLDALLGQLRAVQRVLDGEGKLSTPSWVGQTAARPSLRRRLSLRRSGLLSVALEPRSSAFRHAVRLAVAVPLAELIGRVLSLPRSYWVAFAVVVVLKPDYVTLFRSGFGRVLGTVLGGTLAALIVGGLHPSHSWDVVLVAVTSWAAYMWWPASFAVATTFVTALVLVLLSTTQVDTISTALDRLIDTLVGGALALTVYLAWPTSARGDALERLAALIRAERDYLLDTLSLLSGRPAPRTARENAKAVRVAWTNAEGTVGRSLAEPRGTQIDADLARSGVAAIRRIILATHALAAEETRGLSDAVAVDLAPLAGLFGDALQSIAGAIEAGRRPAALPPLRAAYDAVVAELDASGVPRTVELELDEVVDAIGTLTSVVARAAEEGETDHGHAPGWWRRSEPIHSPDRRGVEQSGSSSGS